MCALLQARCEHLTPSSSNYLVTFLNKYCFGLSRCEVHLIRRQTSATHYTITVSVVSNISPLYTHLGAIDLKFHIL